MAAGTTTVVMVGIIEAAIPMAAGAVWWLAGWLVLRSCEVC